MVAHPVPSLHCVNFPYGFDARKQTGAALHLFRVWQGGSLWFFYEWCSEQYQQRVLNLAAEANPSVGLWGRGYGVTGLVHASNSRLPRD
jgi:hypothetical protein